MTQRTVPAAAQHVAHSRALRPDWRLIPPGSDEFDVYGGKEVVERARRWALDGHYLLARGLPVCAHGLYLFSSCPDLGRLGPCSDPELFDHANLWVVDPELLQHCPSAFLLSHSYRGPQGVKAAASTYANAHSLDLTLTDPAPGDGSPTSDAWYGAGTFAIRLSVPMNWPLWPIEAEASVMLSSQPVRWPPAAELREGI